MKEVIMKLVGNRTGYMGITPGGYYSVITSRTTVQIARVLAIDEVGVHFTLYGKKFNEIPSSINPSELETSFTVESGKPLFSQLASKLGHITIGYLPMVWDKFFGMCPKYLMEEPVKPEELEEYNIWKEEGGAYW